MTVHAPLSSKHRLLWLQPCGVVVVASILVLIQLYFAVDLGWVRVAVAMPLAAALLLAPPIQRHLSARLPHGRQPTHPIHRVVRMLVTLGVRGLGLFVVVGSVVAVTRLVAPGLADWIYTSPNVSPWWVIVVIVTVAYCLIPYRNAPAREHQRGTALRDIESARQAADQRMREWENDDAQ